MEWDELPHSDLSTRTIIQSTITDKPGLLYPLNKLYYLAKALTVNSILPKSSDYGVYTLRRASDLIKGSKYKNLQ